MDDSEELSCPLCTELLDATDRACEFCQCGYAMCLWCVIAPFRRFLIHCIVRGPSLPCFAPPSPFVSPLTSSVGIARCWHQLMENAAKENLSGRCPNCRAVYDKDKITQQAMEPSQCVRCTPRSVRICPFPSQFSRLNLLPDLTLLYSTFPSCPLRAQSRGTPLCRLEEVAREALRKKPERKTSGNVARPRRDLAVSVGPQSARGAGALPSAHLYWILGL